MGLTAWEAWSRMRTDTYVLLYLWASEMTSPSRSQAGLSGDPCGPNRRTTVDWGSAAIVLIQAVVV